MLVKNVIRGNMVTFSPVFRAANNAIINPSAPTLTVYYKSNNVYLSLTSNLTWTGTSWIGTWDSSNADVGIVEWHIAGGPGTSIAQDDAFRIVANKANGGQGAS